MTGMEPNAKLKDYVYKDGIYLEGETARARRLSGEAVRPYTTPEALARKVLGLTADQAAQVVEESDDEWEIARKHDITVMLIRREARPAELPPEALQDSPSVQTLRRVTDWPAGYDCRCRFEPDSVDSGLEAVDAINQALNSMRERGYFEVNGQPVAFDEVSDPGDGRLNLHIGSIPNAVWARDHHMSRGFGFHVWFQRERNVWYGYDDDTDVDRDRAIHLMRYAFFNVLREHASDPYWAWHRVNPSPTQYPGRSR